MFQRRVSIYNETFGTHTYIMVKVICFVLKHKRIAWLNKYHWVLVRIATWNKTFLINPPRQHCNVVHWWSTLHGHAANVDNSQRVRSKHGAKGSCMDAIPP